MSYNQPGPYGGQPQQPGPYGQPPQQPQPGYGYPQQAPPPQGVPPQGYGYPQQPGPYGQPPQQPYGAGPGAYPPPPPPAPKKKTGLIIGAVAVVAAIGVGAYFVFGGGAGGNSAVGDDTKGYKLTPAASVGEYKKDKDTPESMSDKDKKEAEAALGIKNPQQAGAQYKSGSESDPMKGKVLSLTGLWGQIDDPEKAVDGYFTMLEKSSKEEEDSDVTVELVGSPTSVEPAGFEGALMKCQTIKSSPKEGGDAGGLGPKSFELPLCVWADYSTIGAVNVIDFAQMLGTGGKAVPQEQVADLAAKLYNTSRTKA
ncbi:hypothetical protein E2C00_06765 [Streptomyces sp. WAC05374]|uniref:hypothetical protein n=1 Tax=Streptomyces sp. WAC05374 TaxID=2487420 RepID=UPI0010554C33|nr:hypothetical protein [Streptomyces sp. WAC05374]TDF45378.1 hypothetical protein E2B92_13825 [Streptomyces sp. WAC05374]TDF55634.1 hypothetical protein E2C02_13875 [Streptomyces sp. WAC05374]TDF58772.1 hypothetical protein E2C00_06765 [Streptomyces sp. WAC05374]